MKYLASILAAAAANSAFLQPFDDDCSNFNGNVGCTDGQQTRYPDEWSKRSFQTFMKDGPDSD